MYKKINLDKLIIYDLETFSNCFVGNFKDFKTKKKKSFIIYNDDKYKGQQEELFKFIKSCITHGYTFTGFNVLGFDAQVLQYFINENVNFYTSDVLVNLLYEKAQEIINAPQNEKWKVTTSENKLFAPHIDVYKQLHYDRPAKATSLKWLEFTMHYHTVEDMPFEHFHNVQLDEIQDIVDYCWNDVNATEEFFELVKFETDVRLNLSNEYNLNLINAPEPKMVREIFGKFLCEEMNITYNELREMKTPRKEVHFKDIIFPYIKFHTPEFKKILDIFNSHYVITDEYYSWGGNKLGSKFVVKQDNDIALQELRNTTNNHSLTRDMSKFSYSFDFQGMSVDLGLGGIHACVSGGVYKPNVNERLEDADGTSFYPFLAIVNNISPEHLGDSYNIVYPMMYDKRKQYDKKDPRNYIFKIILNSAYGLSNEPNTYLYDPKYTYTITLNGQLSLLMLVEALTIRVPDIKFIQMNTDGITYIYDKQYDEIVRKICKWWEETTKINLEYAYYKQMIIRDVNNYISEYESKEWLEEQGEEFSKGRGISVGDKPKKKGVFETKIQYHKNPSNLIIPKAIEKYFLENINIEDFIKDKNNSIFDYCAAVKKKSNFKLNLVQRYPTTEIIKEQQKVCRFIVTDDNCKDAGNLYKDYTDGRKTNRTSVMAGNKILPLYVIKDTNIEKYPINYDYYIKETQKIIETITPSVTQTTLF